MKIISTSVKTVSTSKTILCSALSTLLWCGDVSGQQRSSSNQDAAVLEEIIVTAQRREQSINDVPIAITAISGDILNERGAQTFADLIQAIPNVAISSFFESRAEISIRGVATSESFQSTDQQPVGIYQDDVFLGSRSVHLAQIFDLDRVEIVRGPQGVLFGRNTTAGAVNYISRAPGDEFTGYITGGYGNFDTGEITAAVDLPVNDAWAMRLSGKVRTSDGWADNVFTDRTVFDYDSWAARAVVRYKSENSTWTLNVHGSDYEGNSGFYFNPDAPDNQGLDFDEFNAQSEESPEDIEAWGTNLTVNFSVGDIDIVSITAYETNDSEAFDDFGVGATGINNEGRFAQFFPFISVYADDYEQFSQELRLSGGSEKIDWVGGVLAYYDDVDSQVSDGGYGKGTIGLDFNGNGVIDVPDEGFFPEDDRRVFNQTTEEIAAFFHLNYSINEQFNVLGGIRYTDSKKELEWEYTDFISGFVFVPRTELDDSWSPLTYRAGLEYTPNDDSLYYARYDHGFKNGGFSVGGSSLADLLIVDEEEINSFELGTKLTLLNGRAQVNAAVFYNEIDDYQANQNVVSDAGLGFAFQNAALVETKGAELEVTIRPTAALLVTGGIGYTDAKFDEYLDEVGGEDFSGHLIPIVPEWSGNLSVTYDFFIEGNYVLTPRLDYSYIGEMEGRHFNHPNEVLDDRHFVNGQLKFGTRGNSTYVAMWIKNALDEEYRTKIIANNDFAAGRQEKRGWPRTYGVTIGYEW